MQKKALATLILLAIGIILVAGPHPCSLRQGENGRPEAACHGMGSGMVMGGMGMDKHAASTRAGRPAHGSRGQGPASCCDIFCQHTCQMPAIAAAQPVAFAIVPVAQTVVESSDPGRPLFAHVVDHVPLT
jgi:hypothetical protein